MIYKFGGTNILKVIIINFLLIKILILYIITIIYLQVKITFNKNLHNPKCSDAIIILGHSINNKYIPSPWLKLRLNTAINLYKNNYANKIIVSGGKGPKDKIPVSHSMKIWLIKNNIPKDSIIIEDMSKNTYENFKYSYKLSTINNINSVIIVTNDFHMYRSFYIASMFFNNISCAPSATDFNFQKLIAYMKEPLSIIKYTFIHFMY